MAHFTPSSLEDAKALISRAERDPSGLPVSAQPHVHRQQLAWLMARLDAPTDVAACQDTGIDLSVVKAWFKDPEFRALHDACLDNKREAVRLLTAAGLPQVIRTLFDLLNSSRSEKTQLGAAALILRVQALLIDKIQTYDKDAIDILREHLRAPAPAPVITVEPRVLPATTE